MKKYLFLTLLCLFSLCLDLNAELFSGECGQSGSNLTWTLDTETGKLVISGTGKITDSSWYKYKDYIRSVDIQDGITNIVSSAFADCTNLKDVIIPGSVTGISYYAFRGCTSLNTISIPSGVQYIGSSAFDGCTGLLSITIPCSSVESYAFQGCTNLRKITIQSSVSKIEKGVFDNCSSVEKVIIENASTPLNLGAGGGYNKGLFKDSPIKTLYLGRNLEYNSSSDYGYSPFYNLGTLVSLTIGEQASYLNDNIFLGCGNLNSITSLNDAPPTCGTALFASSIISTCKLTVPASSVNTYKQESTWGAFKNIHSLTTISGTCGANLTWQLTPEGELIINGKGDMYNFKYYDTPWYDYRSSIETVSLGKDVASIGDYAFYGCTNLECINFPENLISLGKYAFSDCLLMNNISLPEGLLSIGDGAFSGCQSLFSISIPNSVISIGGSSFSNTAWYNTQPDGVVYLGNALYEYKGTESWDTSINVKEGTTQICSYALQSCSGITSITIPSSITTIGDYAFSGCRNLTSISCDAEIPPTCGSSTFAYVDTSIPIYVPASSIPNYKVHESWKNFTNLVRNDIVDSGTGWNGAFTWLFTSSGELIIEGSGELAGSPAYEHKSSIKKISIGNGITSLGNWAFDGYSNVTSIYIPSTVTSLGKGAFYKCYKLNEINIPDGITTINESTFYGCISLTSIQLPESITSIGSDAFYNCSNLNEINIPSSIKNIGPSAFYRCKSTMAINISSIETWLNIEFTNPCYAKNLYLNDELVTNLVIPNTIAEIKNFAFYDCDNLKDLIIPSNVTSIGSMAFYGCENIERISCDCVTPPTIKGDSFYGINNDIPVSVIYPSLAKYQVADYWKNFTNFQSQPVAITINQYGSGTYCSDCALDFSNVNGLKAYVATGYNSHTGVITLTRVMTAKAGVGLFVMGEPGEYNVPVMESTDDNSLNMLVGTLERTPVNGTSDDGLYYNYRYTIKQDSNVPLFYRIDDGYTLGAGKAYLQIPVAWIPTTSESRVISLKIDEENTTDIEEEEKNPVEQIYYDIMGRKVKHIRKGMIYIINGKKTIIN